MGLWDWVRAPLNRDKLTREVLDKVFEEHKRPRGAELTTVITDLVPGVDMELACPEHGPVVAGKLGTTKIDRNSVWLRDDCRLADGDKLDCRLCGQRLVEGTLGSWAAGRGVGPVT